MEKNLPYLSLRIADKAYNKMIIPFLGKLDDGNVFQNIILSIIKVLSIITLVGGVIYSIIEMFGDNNFIDTRLVNGSSGGAIFGAIIGLLFGFAISLICVWALYSVLKKRSEQISELEYDGLLKYVFITLAPKIILLIGELAFISFIYIGVLQIFGALIGSYVYAPLSTLPLYFMEIPGIDIFGSMVKSEVSGDYDNFSEVLQIGVFEIVTGFIVLIYFYISKEVYNYILKVTLNFIKFLPKFAIPFAIRKRVDN